MSQKEKHITRVSERHGHSGGWVVSIHALKHNRFFSDSKHDGEKEALKAAIAHRDKTLREAGIPLTDRYVVATNRPGSTGIPGVHLLVRGKHRAFVVSYSPEPGRKKRKTFTVTDERSEARAKRDAAAFRRKQEEAIYGKTIARNWERGAVVAQLCS